jgi:hypothetical protein
VTKIEQVSLGIAVLRKYSGAEIAVAHDQIFAGPEGSEVVESDADYLRTLSWFRDSESGCWSIFV